MLKKTMQSTSHQAPSGQKVRHFFNKEAGASAIEYAVIAGLISVAIIISATLIGPKVKNLMESVNEALPETEVETSEG